MTTRSCLLTFSKFKNNQLRGILSLAIALVLIFALSAYGLGSNTSSNLTTQEKNADMFGISAGGGFQYLSSSDLQNELDTIKSLGAKWIRVDFSWADIQAGGKTSYSWDRYDKVVLESKARNIKVLGILGYTPTWARPASCTSNDKCAPTNPNDFGTFANAAASRYKDTVVQHWEVWNEPNITTFWQPQPNVQAYVNLLKIAYTNIKSANPNATVITGGLSPASSDGTNISPIDFVQGLYNNGAKNFFDAVGHHPYCYAGTFDCPSSYEAWSAWSQMSQTPTNLRSIMVANGDSNKKIWATEYGAPTKGDQSVSEAQQAQMVTQSYDLIASYEWAGPLFFYSSRDAGTNVSDREDWFGLRRFDKSIKPAFTAYKNASTKYAVSNTTTTQITTTTRPTTTTTRATTTTSTRPTTTTTKVNTTTTTKAPTTTTTIPTTQPVLVVPAPKKIQLSSGNLFKIWWWLNASWQAPDTSSSVRGYNVDIYSGTNLIRSQYLVGSSSTIMNITGLSTGSYTLQVRSVGDNSKLSDPLMQKFTYTCNNNGFSNSCLVTLNTGLYLPLA